MVKPTMYPTLRAYGWRARSGAKEESWKEPRALADWADEWSFLNTLLPYPAETITLLALG